jgi:hypothetical protein
MRLKFKANCRANKQGYKIGDVAEIPNEEAMLLIGMERAEPTEEMPAKKLTTENGPVKKTRKKNAT